MAPQGVSAYALESQRRDGDRLLCNTCRNFDLHSFDRDPFGFRGYKYSAAKDAAAGGCSFCSLLVNSFNEKLGTCDAARLFHRRLQENWWIHLSVKDIFAKPRESEVESGYAVNAGLRISWMQAFLGPKNATLPYSQDLTLLGKPNRWRQLYFHVVADANTPAAAYEDIKGKYAGEDVLSSDYIKMIRDWLRGCLTHPKCCETMSGARTFDASQVPLPTRCVEVVDNGCRIKETGSERGSYITLSHRWTSDTERCCTTTESIDARRRGGTSWLDELPKTFLDTIELARKLCVRYIWIDSLCIIQRGDNGADWQRESTRMADYYQQALVTIAATSGSGDFGLIPPKTTLPPKIARLPYRNKLGCRQGYFYVYSHSLGVDQQYKSFIQKSELLTRGWVFQEWLLSRRIVYFTPAGAFFECQEKEPRNERQEVSESWIDDDAATKIQQLHKSSFLFQVGTDSDLWYRLIESYSALSFTKPDNDRIVALSGIVTEYIEAMRKHEPTTSVRSGKEFASGLWTYDLHRGLLWEQTSPNCCLRRLHQFPTWSWASITCPVAWYNKNEKKVKPKVDCIGLITSSSELIPIQSMNQVVATGGSTSQNKLRINDHIMGLLVKGIAPFVLVRARYNDEQSLDIASNVSDSRKTDREAWRVVCSSLQPTEIAGWASLEHPEYQNEAAFQDGIQFYALQVSTVSRVGVGYGLGYVSPWHDVFNVLLLRNVNGRKYERVGMGSLFGKDIKQQINSETPREMELI